MGTKKGRNEWTQWYFGNQWKLKFFYFFFQCWGWCGEIWRADTVGMEGSCTKLNPRLKNKFEGKKNDVWQQQKRDITPRSLMMPYAQHMAAKQFLLPYPTLQSIIAKCWHCRLYERACEHQRKCLCLWKTLNWSACLAALTQICQRRILLLCQLN